MAFAIVLSLVRYKTHDTPAMMDETPNLTINSIVQLESKVFVALHIDFRKHANLLAAAFCSRSTYRDSAAVLHVRQHTK